MSCKYQKHFNNVGSSCKVFLYKLNFCNIWRGEKHYNNIYILLSINENMFWKKQVLSSLSKTQKADNYYTKYFKEKVINYLNFNGS